MKQLERGREIQAAAVQTEDDLKHARSKYVDWQKYTSELLTRLFSTKAMTAEFEPYFGFMVLGDREPPLQERIDDFNLDLNGCVRRLESIHQRLELIPGSEQSTATARQRPDPVRHLDMVASRFQRVVRQLRARHAERPTLDVRDEYDVQDLLRSLLVLFFDDVREEEGSPSHAGSSPRLDFLLKNERIVIEAKMARKSLSARQLGDELAADIERYRSHPDCGTLYCFVFDPDGYVKNPDGMARDLSGTRDGMRVIVRIEPRH